MTNAEIRTRIAAAREHFNKNLNGGGKSAQAHDNAEDAGVFVNFSNWPQDFHNWSQFSNFNDA